MSFEPPSQDPALVLRISAKAVIIEDGRLLVTRNDDENGDWFLLPGGGQRHGETLPDALMRECLEEVSAKVRVGRLLFVREYIGRNHEFAASDSHAHQVELMFECALEPGAAPAPGAVPDERQTGAAWLPLRELGRYRLYPSALKELLRHGAPDGGPAYLGDVN